MLLDDGRLDASEQPTKYEGDGDRIVDLAQSGDEVGDDVDWEREVADEHEEERLRPAGHAPVASKAAE